MTVFAMNQLRAKYHQDLCCKILARKKNGEVNIADKDSKASTNIAEKLVELIGGANCPYLPSGQEAGRLFAEITKGYLKNAFGLLQMLRPGKWGFKGEKPITIFDQYGYLSEIEEYVSANPNLRTWLGADYIVKSDIVVFRSPIPERELRNSGDDIAKFTPLREINSKLPILHAVVSCKWTIRSDRSQNTRTEALNLIRLRKGNTPHITAVTAEPLPTRIASLALGTGDIDCVYHFALTELCEAVSDCENEDQMDMLKTLIRGRRLRDISDLVFDLAI